MRISTYIKPIKILIILSLLITNACSYIFDYGDWASARYSFSKIDNVTLKSVFKCYYHKSDSSFIEIEYYYSLLNKINISNIDNNIEVSNNFTHNAYTDYKKPQIHIYAPSIKGINIEIASSFNCIDTIVTPKFSFDVTSDLFECNILVNTDTCNVCLDKSTGNFKMSGDINYGNFVNRGLINFDASQSFVNTLFVKHNSPYTMFVNVVNKFSYNIYGEGDIVLAGSPEIDGKVLGNGRLIYQ